MLWRITLRSGFQTECYEVTPGKETHGYSGPLKVSRAGPFTNIGRDFIDTGAKYEPRDGVTDDTNDLYEINKFAVRHHPISIDFPCL